MTQDRWSTMGHQPCLRSQNVSPALQLPSRGRSLAGRAAASRPLGGHLASTTQDESECRMLLGNSQHNTLKTR